MNSMSFLEWFAGFSVMIDLMILTILGWYIAQRWQDRFTLGYCAATGMIICAIGHMVRNGWIWVELAHHPELDTRDKIAQAYPIVGSLQYRVSVLIVIAGLLKLAHTFGRAIPIPSWYWISWLTASALVPAVISTLF